MVLDDLDFFLLDLVVECRFPLDCLGCVFDLGVALNRRIPPHITDELILAFEELFGRGDAIVYVRNSRSSRCSKSLVPSRDEIEAGLRGAFDLFYELTPQGGARWEKLVQPDWSLFMDSSLGSRFWWFSAQSREYLEYKIQTELWRGHIRGAVQWKELRPWRPVLWKCLPRGFRVRFAVPQGVWGVSRPWFRELVRPAWDLENTPKFHRGPADLAPRKVRRPPSEPDGEMTSWPLDKVRKQIDRVGPASTQFAAACEFARRGTTEAVLKLLDYGSVGVQFAAVREMARRRVNAAVPQLLGLVLRRQFRPALWALGEIGDERALPVLGTLLEWGRGRGGAEDGTLIRALARFGDLALPMLEKALASPIFGVPSTAAAALGEIESEASRATLERELEHARASGKSNWYLEEALGVHPRRRTPQDLLKWEVALVVSGDAGGPIPENPIQALAATLSHPDTERRRAAVDLLSELGARDHARQIARLAKDPEWEVRASVAHALFAFGRCRRALEALAQDESPAVRWLATKPVIHYGA